MDTPPIHKVAPAGSAPAQPDATSGTSAVFFENMRQIQQQRRSMQAGKTRSELVGQIRLLVQSVISQIQQAGPLPPRVRDELEALRARIDALADLDLPRQFPPEEYPGVHPVLEILMTENFEHLEARFGRAVAERAFDDVLKSLCPPRRRGRPRAIPLAKVQKAKALRDKGESYGQIARKLDLTPVQVRSALEHHYPKRGKPTDLPHEKKSAERGWTVSSSCHKI